MLLARLIVRYYKAFIPLFVTVVQNYNLFSQDGKPIKIVVRKVQWRAVEKHKNTHDDRFLEGLS